MKNGRGRPIKAYTVKQLEKAGCGANAEILTYCKESGIESITRFIDGKEVELYRFSCLPSEWQMKITTENSATVKRNKKKHPAIIINKDVTQSFRVSQLEKMGCGNRSSINRRYKHLSYLLETIAFCGNKTRLYPFHVLTEKDQTKVNDYLNKKLYGENSAIAKNSTDITATITAIESLLSNLKALLKESANL